MPTEDKYGAVASEDSKHQAVNIAPNGVERQLPQLEEPDLEKSFSVWSLASLCLCLMATWEALSSVVALALISGGAPCLFYN